MSTIETINTSQFYTGPKGDNYIISEIKSNIEELEKDLDLKENSPNPVGSLVMISYGDVEGTEAYNTNLEKDESLGYLDLNGTLWLKQILTDEEINNSEQAIISSDNWCYILQTSLRGKAGKALNFVGSFNIELGKENEESKWWNIKFLEGSNEKGITDADFLKALKEKYSSDLNNLQFADTIVGNFNLYKDGVGEEFEKIYMVVYYIRNQTDLKDNSTIDVAEENSNINECFILNKISGVYTPPKNIVSIEGFSFDTESNKILIGQVSKNNISNTKNNQILIGNNLDLSSAPEGAIALGQHNASSDGNTYFTIGNGTAERKNNLFEIIEKNSEFLVKLNGEIIHSDQLNLEKLNHKIESIKNIPFISTFLDENYNKKEFISEKDDYSVYTKSGIWRTIDRTKYGSDSVSPGPLFETTPEYCFRLFLPPIEGFDHCKVEMYNNRVNSPEIETNRYIKIISMEDYASNKNNLYIDFVPTEISNQADKNFYLYPQLIYTFIITYYATIDKYYEDMSENKTTFTHEGKYEITIVPQDNGELVLDENGQAITKVIKISDDAEQTYPIFNIYAITQKMSDDFKFSETCNEPFTEENYKDTWEDDLQYKVGNVVRYRSILSANYTGYYECLVDHRSSYAYEPSDLTATGTWRLMYDTSMLPEMSFWSFCDALGKHTALRQKFEKEELWQPGEKIVVKNPNFYSNQKMDVYLIGINHDNLVSETKTITDEKDKNGYNILLNPEDVSEQKALLTFGYNPGVSISLSGNRGDWNSFKTAGYYNVGWPIEYSGKAKQIRCREDIPCPKKYYKLIAKQTAGDRNINGEVNKNSVISCHYSFLPSEIELTGSATLSVNEEGSQYKGFQKIDHLPISGTYALRSPYVIQNSWVGYSTDTKKTFIFGIEDAYDKLPKDNHSDPCHSVFVLFCV